MQQFDFFKRRARISQAHIQQILLIHITSPWWRHLIRWTILIGHWITNRKRRRSESRHWLDGWRIEMRPRFRQIWRCWVEATHDGAATDSITRWWIGYVETYCFLYVTARQIRQLDNSMLNIKFNHILVNERQLFTAFLWRENLMVDDYNRLAGRCGGRQEYSQSSAMRISRLKKGWIINFVSNGDVNAYTHMGRDTAKICAIHLLSGTFVVKN